MSKFHARLSSRKWQRIRKLVFRRDKYRCTKCGQPGRLECHHIIDLESGGSAWDIDNLAAYCRSCHTAHHQESAPPRDREREAWARLVAEMLNS